MKKRLFAIILCLCMVTSMFPAFGSTADGIHDARVFYNDFQGSVFISAGNILPEETARFFQFNGGYYTYAESSKLLNILADPAIRIDSWEYDQSGNILFVDTDNDFEPTINIRARYNVINGGYHDEILVRE